MDDGTCENRGNTFEELRLGMLNAIAALEKFVAAVQLSKKNVARNRH